MQKKEGCLLRPEMNQFHSESIEYCDETNRCALCYKVVVLLTDQLVDGRQITPDQHIAKKLIRYRNYTESRSSDSEADRQKNVVC